MPPTQKMRIILKAFDHRVLDVSAQQILETAERTGARVAGPVPMPTTKRMFTVIRSPTLIRIQESILSYELIKD